MRSDGRPADRMRPVRIETGYLMTAEGSALIHVGNTRVLCAASVEDSVPQFLRGSGRGWVTAEYSMLPRSTATRTPREAARGKLDQFQRQFTADANANPALAMHQLHPKAKETHKPVIVQCADTKRIPLGPRAFFDPFFGPFLDLLF